MKASHTMTALMVMMLCACQDQSQLVEHHYLALGTTVTISAYHPPEGYEQLLADKIEPMLTSLDQQWRSFGDGELGVINDRLEQQLCAPISPPTKRLVDRSLELRRLTFNLFDPALGLDVDHWGFRDHKQQSATQTPRAGSAELTQFRFSFADDSWQICADQATRLDLGGIAKGQIIKNITGQLKQAGVNNAIINAGGDLQVIGSRGKHPWRIAIQHPRKANVIASLEAQSGEAFFSSGDYYRYREGQDQRIHHILDPATRAPVQSVIAVTVIHDDPVVADAAATALFVGGIGRFEQISKLLGVKEALLIDDQLRLHTLPQFRAELPQNLH